MNILRPGVCHGIRTIDGEMDECGKPAVALATWEGEEYPACAYHTRKDTAVPLTDILAAAWQDGHDAGSCTCRLYEGLGEKCRNPWKPPERLTQAG